MKKIVCVFVFFVMSRMADISLRFAEHLKIADKRAR